jgi:hypothetical protein
MDEDKRGRGGSAGPGNFDTCVKYRRCEKEQRAAAIHRSDTAKDMPERSRRAASRGSALVRGFGPRVEHADILQHTCVTTAAHAVSASMCRCHSCAQIHRGSHRMRSRTAQDSRTALGAEVRIRWASARGKPPDGCSPAKSTPGPGREASAAALEGYCSTRETRISKK